MKFQPDRIENFIDYKLNNGRDSEQDLKLYNLKILYDSRLSNLLQQLHKQRALHNHLTNEYEHLVMNRNQQLQYCANEIQNIEISISSLKLSIEQKKQERIDKQTANQNKRQEFVEVKLEIDSKILQQKEQHTVMKQKLKEEINLLKIKQQQKIKQIHSLNTQINQRRQKQKIIKLTQVNDSQTRSKHQQISQKSQNLVSRLLQVQNSLQMEKNRINSMEKVIYSRFYDRCYKIGLEFKEALTQLYEINDIKFNNTFELITQLLQKLINRRESVKSLIQQKLSKLQLEQEDHKIKDQASAFVSERINLELLKSLKKEPFQKERLLELELIETGLQEMKSGHQAIVGQLQQKQAEADKILIQLREKVESISNEVGSLRKK